MRHLRHYLGVQLTVRIFFLFLSLSLWLTLPPAAWAFGKKPSEAVNDTYKETKSKTTQKVNERVERAKAAPKKTVDSTVDNTLDKVFGKVDQTFNDTLHRPKQ